MFAQVFLSTRRGAWILNRVGQQGYPIDIVFTTRLKALLKQLLTSSMASDFTERQLNMRFDHAHYGLKPKHRCQGTHPPTASQPFLGTSTPGDEHPWSRTLQTLPTPVP